MIPCYNMRWKTIVSSMLLGVTLSSPVAALDVMLDKWYVGVFSFANGQVSSLSEDVHVGMKQNGLSLGETSIVSRGNLTPRISLLSEHSIQSSYYREDQFRLERLAVRYEINERHWTEFGKIHTPVNYWNDWYHHGRLFYLTVDRPAFFADEFFVMHDIGLRLGGALGAAGLQYDLFLGSGSGAVPHAHGGSDMADDHADDMMADDMMADDMMADDHMTSEHGDQIFPDGVQSLNVALTYPWNNWMFRVATQFDGLRDATPFMRVHTVSVNMENARLHSLLEFAAKYAETEAGEADVRKMALYQYVGYKLNDRMTPYVGLDLISKNRVEGDDQTRSVVKTMLGLSYMPDARMTFKTQLERHTNSVGGHTDDADGHDHQAHTVLIFQLAVGI